MRSSTDCGEHCPFLNRADSRCGGHFQLGGLRHAFELCFDRYTACPVYHELLLDRQQRRAKVQVTLSTEDARERFTQLGLPRRKVAA